MFGSTLPSAVRRHLRLLPKDFAIVGITAMIAKAGRAQQWKATAQTEKMAVVLRAEQARLAATVVVQSAKIKTLEARRAPAPAPSPHGGGAGGGRTGRAGDLRRCLT